MTKRFKRTLSILLSLIMIFSLFTVVPTAANAATADAAATADPDDPDVIHEFVYTLAVAEKFCALQFEVHYDPEVYTFSDAEYPYFWYYDDRLEDYATFGSVIINDGNNALRAGEGEQAADVRDFSPGNIYFNASVGTDLYNFTQSRVLVRLLLTGPASAASVPEVIVKRVADVDIVCDDNGQDLPYGWSASFDGSVVSAGGDYPVVTDISGCTATLSYTISRYNGKEKKPVPTVTDGDTVLTKDVDYTVEYTDNIDIGPALVTITGIGAYTGTLTASFTIYPADVTGLEVVGTTADSATLGWDAQDNVYGYRVYCYNDKTKKWDGVKYIKSDTTTITGLTAGTEYRYAVKAYQKVDGVSYFSRDYAEVAFTLAQKDISVCSVKLSYTISRYSGKEKKPVPTVTDGDTVLTKGVDYTVAYSDNIDIGPALVTITGIGDYTGTLTASFTIYPADVTGLEVVGKTSTSVTLGWDAQDNVYGYRVYCYNTKTKKWAGVKYIKSDTTTITGLTAGTEYRYAVKAYQKVDGVSYFSRDYAEVAFTLTQKDISVCSVKLSYTISRYSGKEKKPVPTVTDGDTVLTKGVDYTVAYSDNIEIGPAYVTITGIGDYTGTLVATFTIYPADVTGLKVVSKTSTSVKLSWDAQDNVYGYRVYCYNTKTKKWEGVKYITSSTTTISGLTAGTEYRYAVKAYQKVDGVSYFSRDYAEITVTTNT